MKQIDNRQKQHILSRAFKFQKGSGFSIHRGKEKMHAPEPREKSSQGTPAAEAPAEQTTPVSPAVKAGRNEPCPCGSGKKYKKCCLLKS